ncbi:MAG: Crp/Fnr family transcriptional regulator [Deltaproteobacteria bacterium]|nr:Crp/Fnr family transcriptional regulator [Deltaproteobacteria bacterium]MBW2447277.1 Crp/Fnr family transcriptional regulator [Deltaproteobacteria bacterium]
MAVELAFLRKVPLFAELEDEELTEIGAHFHERSYPKNSVIFLEDETGDYMYIVRQGRVKVVRQLPSGKETILAFHDSGEFFGEMSLLDGGTTPASVIAVAPTTILSLSRRDFRNQLANPKVNEALLRMLCQRCREAWSQVELLTLHHAEARIRSLVHQLCESKGEVEPDGVRIGSRLTHRELADMAGITRESASRAVSRLQKLGLLRMESGSLLVLDQAQLLDFADEI